MAKQLNIRSDEAFEIAHRIAVRDNVPVTEAVVQALRSYGTKFANSELSKLPKVEEMTPAQRADYEALRALAKKAAKGKKPGATSDHTDMYDEFGLPI